MAVKRTCRFCEREIAVNPVTGGLRSHNVPDTYPHPDMLMVRGEQCPGTGSRPQGELTS